jgi:hypothetical protein
MVYGFKIIPLTKIGEDAINKVIIDEKQELIRKNPQEKAIYNAFTKRTLTYNHEIKFFVYEFLINEKIPAGLNLFISKNKLTKLFINQIPEYISLVTKAMGEHGALIDQDFYLEVYQNE